MNAGQGGNLAAGGESKALGDCVRAARAKGSGPEPTIDVTFFYTTVTKKLDASNFFVTVV